MTEKKGQESIGILISYANIILNFIVGILYTPYMIKTLGQSEYGLYLQIGALVGYMTFADFGLHSTITRYVAKYRAEHNDDEQMHFLGNCFWFYILVTIVLSAVGIFFVTNISWFLSAGLSSELRHIAEIMSVFLFVSLVMSLPLGMFSSILQGYGQFFITNGVKFISIILKTIVLLFVLKINGGAVGIVVVDTVFNLLIPMIYALILCCKFGTRIRLVRFDIARIKEILGYSGYIFILAMVNQVYWKIGQVVLGKILSPDASAVYGLAVQIVNYVTPITLTISGVFLPRITAMVINGQGNMSKINALLNTIGKYQALLIMLIVMGFLSFGQQFVMLWVGSEFQTTYYIVCILLCAIVPQSVLTVGTSTLKAQGKHKYQALVYGLSAVANVLIGIMLSYAWGEIGMAVGTFISVALIQTPLMIWVFVKKAGLDIPQYFGRLLKQLAIPLMVSAVAIFSIGRIFVLENWLPLFCAIIASCAIYGFIVYRWCLDEKEKGAIWAQVERIKKSAGGRA